MFAQTLYQSNGTEPFIDIIKKEVLLIKRFRLSFHLVDGSELITKGKKLVYSSSIENGKRSEAITAPVKLRFRP